MKTNLTRKDAQARAELISNVRYDVAVDITGADEFTVRDCYQALKGTFPRRADINPGLAVLMERGYIRRPQPPPDTKPGRPSERLQVNPAIRRR